MDADVIIVGAGAAGLMAAMIAAREGAEVLLLERNKNIGRKLLITGAGRCNLTNNTEVNELVNNIPGNGRFLYSVFQKFGPQELMNLVESEFNVPLKVERGRRVFPESDKAVDIVAGFEKTLKKLGVRILNNVRVNQIMKDESNSVVGVKAVNGDKYLANKVIVATGGASYPGTGSTGDGYQLARSVGHSVIDIYPSLVPLETFEEWPQDVEGLTLNNVEVSCYHKDRKIGSEFGDLLFTSYGVSGPTVLSLSRSVVPLVLKEPKSVKLEIDLKPALTVEELDRRLQRDFEKYSRKLYKNALDDLLPKSLIPVMIELSKIDGLKPVHQVTRAERQQLVGLFKGLALLVEKPRPFSEAIVTAGGVNVKEINPKTMESKLVSGLYFIGEVVDVDGYTGGYNLQIAFSMGYIAGKHAANLDE
ncbi:MAG TPA: NAD(P)/FAD-dependent oxidoreductase [Bacillota bacterium]|nr:NAD(P)/FAD-dependent oxidoreductase [Bacillota bacterium]HOL09324.1 NAD(P)/FAD-dependent oxidoreductase [Bacillota bacterium]HPO97645.1 NAD(P)/FAD-dependent oxidoreductase [Bacillota bacterium]